MELVAQSDFIYAALLGLVLQIILWMIFRKKIVGVFDIFFFNMIYVCFGSAGLIFSYLTNENDVIAKELMLLVVWILGMLIASWININPNFFHKPKRVVSFNNVFDKTALLVVSVVYLSYFFQILQSGLFQLAASLVDSRFVVVQENKFQAYIFSACALLPAVLIMRTSPRLSFRKLMLVLLPFWLVQIATFSKTGMLFPVIAVAIYYALCVRAGAVRPPSLRTQIFSLLGLSFSVYVIFSIITLTLTESEFSVFDSLLNRLFGSFDGLFYLSKINVSSSLDASLIQWYFGPALKVLGLFSQEFSSFNYFIALQYFGYGADHVGNLPNNNHIGELILAFPGALAFVGAMCSGFLYGQIYFGSLRYVKSGGPWIVVVAFVVATPFGFLIDGQGWSIAIFCAAIVNTMVVFLVGLARFSLALIRANRSHIRRSADIN